MSCCAISRASTISDEGQKIQLTEEDFIRVQQNINRINQKLSNLCKNWQVDYRNAVTQEDCNEVERFYQPFLNESKYRILYQMLHQMIRQVNLADLPSTHEQKPDFTPSLGALDDAQTLMGSLAALDDAQILMGREWNRNEPGKEILRQYTTIVET